MENKGNKIRLQALVIIVYLVSVAFYLFALNRAAFEDYFILSLVSLILMTGVWFGMMVGLVMGLLGVFAYLCYHFFLSATGYATFDFEAHEIFWLALIAVAAILGGALGDTVVFVRRLFGKYRDQIHSLLTTGQLGILVTEAAFEQSLKEECSRAKRSLAQFCLIYFDIANLKELEAKLGADAADEASEKLAKVLCTNTRDIDKKVKMDLTLYGLILPACPKNQAPVVVERIQKGLRDVPLEYRGRLIKADIHLVAGVSCYPEDGATAEVLREKVSKNLVVNRQLDEGFDQERSKKDALKAKRDV